MPDLDPRWLVTNQLKYQGADPSLLFEILWGIVQREDWFTLLDKDGNPVNNFLRLIEEPPPVGCNLKRDKLEKLLELKHRNEDQDEDVAKWMKDLRKFVGSQLEKSIKGLNSNGTNQHSGFDMSNPKAENLGGGNSRAYRIALLDRDAPDLAERVINRELSAAAGIRELRKRQGKPEKVSGTISFVNASKAINTLTEYMPEDVLGELIELLNSYKETEL